jgi:hypothetical protein
MSSESSGSDRSRESWPCRPGIGALQEVFPLSIFSCLTPRLMIHEIYPLSTLCQRAVTVEVRGIEGLMEHHAGNTQTQQIGRPWGQVNSAMSHSEESERLQWSIWYRGDSNYPEIVLNTGKSVEDISVRLEPPATASKSTETADQGKHRNDEESARALASLRTPIMRPIFGDVTRYFNFNLPESIVNDGIGEAFFNEAMAAGTAPVTCS